MSSTASSSGQQPPIAKIDRATSPIVYTTPNYFLRIGLPALFLASSYGGYRLYQSYKHPGFNNTQELIKGFNPQFVRSMKKTIGIIDPYL
jgi:hypothetical protein